MEKKAPTRIINTENNFLIPFGVEGSAVGNELGDRYGFGSAGTLNRQRGGIFSSSPERSEGGTG